MLTVLFYQDNHDIISLKVSSLSKRTIEVYNRKLEDDDDHTFLSSNYGDCVLNIPCLDIEFTDIFQELSSFSYHILNELTKLERMVFEVSDNEFESELTTKISDLIRVEGELQIIINSLTSSVDIITKLPEVVSQLPLEENKDYASLNNEIHSTQRLIKVSKFNIFYFTFPYQYDKIYLGY